MENILNIHLLYNFPLILMKKIILLFFFFKNKSFIVFAKGKMT
ncbi:hypothetical protein PFHG_04432 [Plasmodium falciparum HB3]|uniref:Uncharacterized protein n=1 Tax=Plasmodium falciparum (isolate HB3) TaxID=137071 RepID=A0A0L7KIH4_PLAFX|nr:hypothetical protein PFHG_04432 [Plasmodium falciparum HB3]